MITLKRYANRKFYGEYTEFGVIRKGYLTLDDIANLVRQGKEFQIVKHNKGAPEHGQDVTLETIKQCLTRLVIPDNIVRELIQKYKSEETL